LSSCCKKSTDSVLTSATGDKVVEAYVYICCLLIAESTDQKWVSQDTSLTLMRLFLDIWQDTKLPFRVEATKE